MSTRAVVRGVLSTLLAFPTAAVMVSAPHAQAAAPIGAPSCGETGGALAPSNGSAVRVASFNVLHGNTESPPEYPAHSSLDARLELEAQQLVSDGIDVVGLQEVADTVANQFTQHLGGNVVTRLAARMSALTGQRWYWCWFLANPHFPGEPDIATGGGGPLSDQLAALAYANYASFKEGEAVLSRFPIADSEGRRLPGRAATDEVFCPPADIANCTLGNVFESRSALWVDIEAPGGPLQLTTTHLANDTTNETGASVFEQMLAVLALSDEHAAASPPARRFITCDCNVETTSPLPVVSTVVAAGWTDTWASLHPNLDGFTNGPDIIVTPTPTRVLNARIDYVFARAGSCGLDATASTIVVDDAGLLPSGSFLFPSDHAGVATDIATAC